MPIHKKLIFTLLLLSLLTPLVAQNTDSPYSMYGFGQLSDNAFAANRGMGSIGYAQRSNKLINALNPAAYTAMDSLSFLFDIGFYIQQGFFKEGDKRGTFPNGNLAYVAMQFPLFKRMAMSVGINQVTKVGYTFGSSTSADELSSYSGEGGLNKVYVGAAYQPIDALSFGANLNYIFGSITHRATSYPGGNNVQFSDIWRVDQIGGDFGVQYIQRINQTSTITLGATYTPKLVLNGTVQKFKGTELTTDTLMDRRMDNDYSLPQSFGIGIGYVKTNKLTAGIDVLYENWKNASFGSPSESFNDRIKISLGAEYLPNLYGNSYLERIRYRAGLFVNNSYYQVNGSKLSEIGVSCGFGFPLRSDRSLINVSLEYISKQPGNKTLLSEEYLRMSVSINLNEFWFFKRKFE